MAGLPFQRKRVGKIPNRNVCRPYFEVPTASLKVLSNLCTFQLFRNLYPYFYTTRICSMLSIYAHQDWVGIDFPNFQENKK